MHDHYLLHAQQLYFHQMRRYCRIFDQLGAKFGAVIGETPLNPVTLYAECFIFIRGKFPSHSTTAVNGETPLNPVTLKAELTVLLFALPSCARVHSV